MDLRQDANHIIFNCPLTRNKSRPLSAYFFLSRRNFSAQNDLDIFPVLKHLSPKFYRLLLFFFKAIDISIWTFCCTGGCRCSLPFSLSFPGSLSKRFGVPWREGGAWHLLHLFQIPTILQHSNLFSFLRNSCGRLEGYSIRLATLIRLHRNSGFKHRRRRRRGRRRKYMKSMNSNFVGKYWKLKTIAYQ